MELILNEVDSKRKYKLKSKINNITNIKSMNRLSIDCKTQIFQSNDNLPQVSLNIKDRASVISVTTKIGDNKYDTPHNKPISCKKNNKPILKELKHVRFNIQRYNSLKTNDAHSNNTSNVNSIETEKVQEKVQEKSSTKKKSKFFSKSNKNIDSYDYNYKNIEETKKKMLTSNYLLYLILVKD